MYHFYTKVPALIGEAKNLNASEDLIRAFLDLHQQRYTDALYGFTLAIAEIPESELFGPLYRLALKGRVLSGIALLDEADELLIEGLTGDLDDLRVCRTPGDPFPWGYQGLFDFYLFKTAATHDRKKMHYQGAKWKLSDFLEVTGISKDWVPPVNDASLVASFVRTCR